MSCLNPIILDSPKRKLSLYGGIPYKISVGCGQCAECKKQTQTEWNFRSYYESKFTIDNDGFVYFDTLTYAPVNRPKMSDYVSSLKNSILDHDCFSTEHYRMFFVKLREYMKREGYGSENLKYFLSSEYGEDDRYTHAPHFHVLFFVMADIDPLEFSRLVKKAWIYGRTDGIDYKPKDYVMNHVFMKGKCEESHLMSICNYVSKYVTKQNKFMNVVNSRFYYVKCKLFRDTYGKDWEDEYLKDDKGNYIVDDLGIKKIDYDAIDFYLDNKDKEKLKKLKKNCMQFHRQSQQFGAAMVLYNDMEKVFETGMISMPDKNNVVKHTKLPMYYERKLFYEVLKDADGKSYWQITSEGIKYKLVHKLKSIEVMVQKFKDWEINMKGRMMVVDDEVDDIENWYREHYDKFNELLGERSIRDFVIYLLCYKGRIKPDDGNYNLDSFVMKQYLPMQDYYEIVYNYTHSSYKKLFGSKFVTDKNLGDKNEGFSLSTQNFLSWSDTFEQMYGFRPSLKDISLSPSNKSYRFGRMVAIDLFAYKHVIDENTLSQFKDFDKMYSIWCDSLKYSNVNKNKVHDLKEDLKDKMKNVYFN